MQAEDLAQLSSPPRHHERGENGGFRPLSFEVVVMPRSVCTGTQAEMKVYSLSGVGICSWGYSSLQNPLLSGL